MDQIQETALTQEELAVKEQALINMKVRTMRRSIFKSLMPYEYPPEIEVMRKDAVALLIVSQKGGACPELYILFANQRVVQMGPAVGTREQAPPRLRWILDLPRVSVA